MIDIPSVVAAFATGGGLAAVIAALIKYGGKKEAEKDFKIDTIAHFVRIEKHIEATDKAVAILKEIFNEQAITLAEIRQNQISHDISDKDDFKKILDKLDLMDRNFKEIWQTVASK